MDLTDGIVIAIVPLVITGLAVVAYRHQNEYEQFRPWLLGLAGMFSVGAACYGLGVSAADHAVRAAFANSPDLAKISSVVYGAWPSLWVVSGFPLIAMAYLQFLSAFPRWLTKRPPIWCQDRRRLVSMAAKAS